MRDLFHGISFCFLFFGFLPLYVSMILSSIMAAEYQLFGKTIHTQFTLLARFIHIFVVLLFPVRVLVMILSVDGYWLHLFFHCSRIIQNFIYI